MRDAYGGVVNLAMIVVFLVLVSGYLAFNVNYTKAFRVKNYIITTLEQYEGNYTNEECQDKILSYINQVGYNAPSFEIAGFDYCNYGYCIKEYEAKNSSEGVDEHQRQSYYRVVTQINIDIPIINNIMPGLKIFQIAGDTKLITHFE